MKQSVESLGSVRAKGIALLVVTFIIGALAGGAVERARVARQAAVPPQPVEGHLPPLGQRRLPTAFRQLNLTASQRQEIAAILERAQPRTQLIMHEWLPRLRAVTDSVHAEIRAVLTPEQAARFDSLMADMRRRAGPGRERLQGGGRAPRMGPPPRP